MNIEELKINGFGKFNNKQLFLKQGINIIKGSNEAGKSTIVKFILGSFYGASKNKKGKEISDFEKYEPWSTNVYSGKIIYELDSGKEYEIYRDFRKKNPIIYNENKEDISSKFTIDKTKGIEFFETQTNVDEDTFLNTSIVEQESVKLDKSSQNLMIQKISNMVSSGDDNVSFKNTLNKINKKQNDEIGTERTSQKPINIVKEKIQNLSKRKNELEQNREKLTNFLYIIEDNKFKIESENKKIEFLNELKNRLDNNRVKNAEINFGKNLEEKYNKKIYELNNIIDENKNKKNSKKFIIYIILDFLIAVLFTVLMFFRDFNKSNFLLIIPFSLIFLKIIIEIKKYKNNKKINVEKIENEIDVLLSNLENQKNDIAEKEIKLKTELENSNKNIIKKYVDDIDIKFIEKYLYKEYDEIQKEIEHTQKEANTLKVKTTTMEKELAGINESLEDLARVEESLEELLDEKGELETLNNSYNIAKECLEKAYSQVKSNITPQFTDNLCKIMANISNGKYTNIKLNDNDGLEVEIENGMYIPVSELSTGTIDQMYLSLRLSALDEITDEKIPIILDETFAYFDDERLDNIIKYLKNNFRNQIIILTCTNREIESLNRLNIEYNLINLEN